MSAAFARERVHTLWPELMPLLREHWREIDSFQDIALNPDVATYEAAEEQGLLRVYTARIDGALIGYAVVLVNRSLHSQQSLQARGDVIFVAKAHRASGTCSALLDYAESALKAEGAELASFHVNPDHPALGRRLTARGYSRSEIVYARRL